LITKLSTRPQTQLPEKWKIEYINKCAHTQSAVSERKTHSHTGEKRKGSRKGRQGGRGGKRRQSGNERQTQHQESLRWKVNKYLKIVARSRRAELHLRVRTWHSARRKVIGHITGAIRECVCHFISVSVHFRNALWVLPPAPSRFCVCTLLLHLAAVKRAN